MTNMNVVNIDSRGHKCKIDGKDDLGLEDLPVPSQRYRSVVTCFTIICQRQEIYTQLTTF